GRVDDGGEVDAVGGEPVQQAGQRGAVGGVAGGERDAGAGGGQLVAQLAGAGRVLAAPAEQHQVLGAAVGQPAGDVAAEGAGPARHQHGAGQAGGGRVGGGARRLAAGQARRER